MSEPMPEPAPEEHEMGPAELSAVSALNGDWATISIDQTGPDGTEVIAMLVFLSCPICHATVAPVTEPKDFPQLHTAWHVKQARDWDRVNGMPQEVAGAEEQDPEPDDDGQVWQPPTDPESDPVRRHG